MKKINFMAMMATVMVMVMASCGKEPILDSVSRSDVNPTVITDSIPVHDTTVVVDTAWRDSIAPGVFQIITFEHLFTGEWLVTGNTASITAGHLGKITNIENGVSHTVDSTVFTETGTMVWHFQTVYTQSIDGNWPASASGCSALGATCDTSWTYNVPEQYAPYFEGHCEQVPYLTIGNGNQVTVKTSNGQHNRQATFSVNVDIPGPQITDVTATCVHDNWGNWHVINGGIQIDGTNTVTETTHYDNGTSTVTGTGTYACHSTYMFNSRPTSYDHAIDGTYPVIGNTVADLGISMTHTHNHDNPIILNGHNYTNLAPDCDLEIYQVTVVGNNITLNGRGLVNGQYVYKDYTYSVTINIPTPTTDTTIFGNIKYWCWVYAAVNYFAPATGDGWVLLVITTDNHWHTSQPFSSPSAATAAGLSFTDRGTISASDYAYVVSVSNFTDPEKSGSRCCAAWCRNSTAGANASVFSVVKYDPNNGHAQIKYRNTSGVIVGVCSAASGTIEASQAVPEPVGVGGVADHFQIGSQTIH